MWLIINDSYVLDCIFFFFLRLAKNYCDVIALFFWRNTSLPPHLHHSPSPVYKLEYRELYKIYRTVSKIYSWLEEHWKKWKQNCSTPFQSLETNTCTQRPLQIILFLFCWPQHKDSICFKLPGRTIVSHLSAHGISFGRGVLPEEKGMPSAQGLKALSTDVDTTIRNLNILII